MNNIVSIQEELRQELPRVTGNKDYKQFRDTLCRMGEIIKLAKCDNLVISHKIQEAEEAARVNAQKKGKRFNGLSQKIIMKIAKVVSVAIRTVIARRITGDSFRVFTCRLADSPLFQNFCGINQIDEIKVPTKSTLERYEKMIPEELIRKIVQQVNIAASSKAEVDKKQALRLEVPVNLSECYMDTTCVKANIHFPVDWVLLRDATRTLMKAVQLIRNNGLKNRMDDPKKFIRQINCLSIEMTHTRHKKDGRKKRKAILRGMKKLLEKIAKHAKKHMDLLKDRRQATDLTEAEAHQIIKRIEGVLEKLPVAIWQAHERIIGERLVANDKKLLSLYEDLIHVIVRGKADAQVEFGNTLLLTEQSDGLIVDWKLHEEKAPADSKQLPDSLKRLSQNYEGFGPGSITTDRGFYSKLNEIHLLENGIEDCMCPKPPDLMQERVKDEVFNARQKRRAQTEGRIAILKNNFLGKPLRSKGFVSRNLNVAWGILAHNLWVIARLPRVPQVEFHQQAA